MNYELTQRFYFEAAHTLEREIEVESSRRIHGHTYIAEVPIAGVPDARGMVSDLGVLRRSPDEVRDLLDHRLLNDVEGLGRSTLENPCKFLWQQIEPRYAGLSRVVVRRDASGDSCTLQRPGIG